MNRLWLLVLENNEPAKNLYKKMGFVNEGVQRQAIFKEGQYHDYIMMSLLRGEYENGR
jgi:diamine N-acetyltransferase